MPDPKLTTSTDIGNFLAAANKAAGRDILAVQHKQYSAGRRERTTDILSGDDPGDNDAQFIRLKATWVGSLGNAFAMPAVGVVKHPLTVSNRTGAAIDLLINGKATVIVNLPDERDATLRVNNGVWKYHLHPAADGTGALTADVTAEEAARIAADAAHAALTNNPHAVTKAQVGLTSADDTSDADKPVSTATQTALDLKAPLASPTFTGTVGGITKAMVGLTNVDNTSNATERAAVATLTNKRNQPRTASSTTAATLAPDLATANFYYRTTQTELLTIGAPIGTPVIGETIGIEVNSAAAQTLTINSIFKAMGTAFPATTTAGKTFKMVAQFDGTDWKTTHSSQV